jgi:hypothetical protein
MALGRPDISRLSGSRATGRQTNFPPADVVPVSFSIAELEGSYHIFADNSQLVINELSVQCLQ